MEIELALDYGYVIDNLWEIYAFWPEDHRPIFRDFFKLLLSLRIKYSPVPSSYLGRESIYCQEVNSHLNLSGPLCLNVDDLRPNKTAATYMKSFSNIGT